MMFKSARYTGSGFAVQSFEVTVRCRVVDSEGRFQAARVKGF